MSEQLKENNMSELRPLFYKIVPVIFWHFVVRIRVFNFSIIALTIFSVPHMSTGNI